MKILLTRPEQDNDGFRARLEALGHYVVSSAMFEIEMLDVPQIQLENVQGIVITSRNALRAIKDAPQLPQLCKLPIYAVGDATASAARSLGFANVIVGPGRASDLVEMIVSRVNPRDGRLFHFRGEDIALDIQGALAEEDFEVNSTIVYRTVLISSLNNQAADALRAGKLDTVILLSPRTAQAFAKVVIAAGMREIARKLTYACISQRTARELDALEPHDVRVAACPTIEEVLAAVNLISAQTQN